MREDGGDKGQVMTAGWNRGGEAPSSPAHPTFMVAQGALLTTNKSTARSNLSRRSVGRGSGVWGNGGKEREKGGDERRRGGGEKDRKSDKERG